MTNTLHKVKLLIVEDEILLAKDIGDRLGDMGYEVLGLAPTADRALQIINNGYRIDLALIDIMLHGQDDGIGLAKTINEKHAFPFIYLTSHADIHLVEKAKATKPDAYALKPFNDRQIAVHIEMALHKFARKNEAACLGDGLPNNAETNGVLKINDSLFIKSGFHYQRVLISDILFLEADNCYTTIYTTNGKFVYAMALKKMELRLPQKQFLRVHRTYMVNIQSVSGFEGNTLYFGKKAVPVSRSFRQGVFELFDKL